MINFDEQYAKESAQIGHKEFLIHLLKKEIKAHLKVCEHLRAQKETFLATEKKEKDEPIHNVSQNG